MCKKIHSYHQKNLRNNIKVKVHKEYCDEIFHQPLGDPREQHPGEAQQRM